MKRSGGWDSRTSQSIRCSAYDTMSDGTKKKKTPSSCGSSHRANMISLRIPPGLARKACNKPSKNKVRFWSPRHETRRKYHVLILVVGNPGAPV